MPYCFTRNVGEIQLFDETYKIVSTPLVVSIELDLVKQQGIPQEHLELHKMLRLIETSLAINYENYSFWKNPLQFFKNRKLKKVLSYKNLRANLDINMLSQIILVIQELNTTEQEKKKAKAKVKVKKVK